MDAKINHSLWILSSLRATKAFSRYSIHYVMGGERNCREKFLITGTGIGIDDVELSSIAIVEAVLYEREE
jgi:hypothetical protein